MLGDNGRRIVPQLSGNGREDTGGKRDIQYKQLRWRMRQAGLDGSTTTQNWEFAIERSQTKKEGARNCGERSERVEVKAGIAE
jgi:hypothetical protein